MVSEGNEAGHAGSDVASYQDRPTPTRPSGIGGWLLLPLLRLIISPIVWLYGAKDFVDVWEARSFLTNAQSVFLIIEFVVNLGAFIAAPLALLVLMFKKLDIFPGLYIIWICALPVLVFLDAVLSLWVFDGVLTAEDAFDGETKKAIAQGVGQAVLWTLYMNRSERVENTFVN